MEADWKMHRWYASKGKGLFNGNVWGTRFPRGGVEDFSLEFREEALFIQGGV